MHSCGRVAALQIRSAEALIGFVRVGRESDGALQLGDRLGVFTGSAVSAAQSEVNLRQTAVELLRLLRRGESFVCPEAVFFHAVHSQAGVSDAAIRQREIGILGDRLVEIVERSLNVFALMAAQGVSAVQVKVIRSNVVGGPRSSAGHFVTGRIDVQSGNELVVDLVLDGEEVASDAIEFVAPKTAAVCAVFQIDGDTDFVAGTLQRALNEQVRA